ncbi:MAG: hypothetical protein P8L47_01445 [Candidatus Marinamargulisbacteria bacterium]|nr:hypothetical protein [Candidatus Marinamargulisbacteria bacterium]
MSEFITQLTHDLSRRAQTQGVRYTLDAFYTHLNQLGNPHQNLPPCLHVAGTHGKGSTVSFLVSGLMAMGYTVGAFMSPHIRSYAERIQINKTPIKTNDFWREYHAVFEKLTLHQTARSTTDLPTNEPTEFEVLTLVSFLYFQEKQPDFIVVETGLGGRLDATNVIMPVVCGITRIGWDHMDVLGNTLVDIAAEKAGIIKPRIPIVSVKQDSICESVLSLVASDNQAPYQIADPLDSLNGFVLNANVQRENAGLALAMLSLIFPNININESIQAFKKTTLWGRYTTIRLKQPKSKTMVVDAAHNVESIRELVAQIRQDYPDEYPDRCVFVMGVLNRKAYRDMLDLIEAPVRLVDFQPGVSVGPNATVPDTVTHHTVKDPNLFTGPLVVVTGSIYFLGEIAAYLPE